MPLTDDLPIGALKPPRGMLAIKTEHGVAFIDAREVRCIMPAVENTTPPRVVIGACVLMIAGLGTVPMKHDPATMCDMVAKARAAL